MHAKFNLLTLGFLSPISLIHTSHSSLAGFSLRVSVLRLPTSSRSFTQLKTKVYQHTITCGLVIRFVSQGLVSNLGPPNFQSIHLFDGYGQFVGLAIRA